MIGLLHRGSLVSASGRLKISKQASAVIKITLVMYQLCPPPDKDA